MHRYATKRHPSSPTRTLMPGDLVCDRAQQYLGTVLGSCVAVCLWDSQLRFGGMNHFLLPNRPSNGDYSFKFGDVAVPELIDSMLAQGSRLHHLQAKLFGGAYVLHAGDPAFAVGRRNVEIAVAELIVRRIPIVASRLSGTQGLVIRQCTSCGDVRVRPAGTQEKMPRPETVIANTTCVSKDISAAMLIRGGDGLPIAISTRSTTSRQCNLCSPSSFGR